MLRINIMSSRTLKLVPTSYLLLTSMILYTIGLVLWLNAWGGNDIVCGIEWSFWFSRVKQYSPLGISAQGVFNIDTSFVWGEMLQ